MLLNRWTLQKKLFFGLYFSHLNIVGGITMSVMYSDVFNARVLAHRYPVKLFMSTSCQCLYLSIVFSGTQVLFIWMESSLLSELELNHLLAVSQVIYLLGLESSHPKKWLELDLSQFSDLSHYNSGLHHAIPMPCHGMPSNKSFNRAGIVKEHF